MVIAATTFAQAAFCFADDPRLIRCPPRAAAAILAHVFTPGRAEICASRSKIAAKNKELRRELEIRF
jgi:hypothetical protein